MLISIAGPLYICCTVIGCSGVRYPKIVHAPRSQVYKISAPRYDHLPIQKSDNKNDDKDFTKLSPIIKCYKCQGYGHVAEICTNIVKIAPTDIPLDNSEPELDEFAYYVDEDD